MTHGTRPAVVKAQTLDWEAPFGAGEFRRLARPRGTGGRAGRRDRRAGGGSSRAASRGAGGARPTGSRSRRGRRRCRRAPERLARGQQPATVRAQLKPPKGDHVQAERVREREHGGHDRRVLVLGAEPVDERAVDLEHLDRQRAQARERGVPGPEVVDADVDAEALDRSQAVQRGGGGAHQRGLGQLQAQRLGRDAGGERVRDHGREVRVLELAGGDVDRDRQRRQALGVPGREIAHGGAQHPGAERADQPRLLGHRDELGREASLQRTSASTPTRRPLARSSCGW